MTNYYVRAHVETLIDVTSMVTQELRRNINNLSEREKTALSVIEDIHSELIGVRATLRVEEGFKYERV